MSPHVERFRAVHSALSPPVIFLVLAATVVLLFVSFAPDIVPPKGGGELGKNKNVAKKEALAITLELNKLVISLSTLIFGAVGALVIGKDGIKRLSRSQVSLTLVTLLCSSSALYFSYLIYYKLVFMLSHNFLELDDKSVAWPRQFQVDSLGIAVVMLAALFLTTSAQALAVNALAPHEGESNDVSSDMP